MKKKLTAEQYFTELSSLILEFTTEYRIQVVNQVLTKNEYIKEPERFFYTLIHKTACSFEAANVFIRNFDSRREYHPSLFIILRAILSDILVAEYITYCSESDEHANELINGIYFDHIENVIKTCKTTYRNIYQWNEAETNSKINELKSNSRFFTSEGIPTVKGLSTSLNKLIVKIWQSTKDKRVLYYHRRIYGLYGIFSKFEHLGELSFHLTHKGYDDTKKESLYFDLYDSTVFIVVALLSYAKVWKDIVVYDLEYFKKLQKKIENMRPEIIK